MKKWIVLVMIVTCFYGLAGAASYVEPNAITPTASTQATVWGAGYAVSSTVDRVGLNIVNLTHDAVSSNYWHSYQPDTGGNSPAGATVPPAAEWLAYEFNNVYTIRRMLVWNGAMNVHQRSARNVRISHSTDGVNWTALPVTQLADTTGVEMAGRTYSNAVDFGNIDVKYVVIDIIDCWGDQYGTADGWYLMDEVLFQKKVPLDADFGDGVSVAESGETSDTYTLVMAEAPVANVTVTINFDSSQISVDPEEVTFTPTDYSDKVITVTAVDDSLLENTTHGTTITHAVSDVSYEIDDIQVSITDNDLTCNTYGYIPADEVTAEASSYMGTADPNQTINLSGINPVTLTSSGANGWHTNWSGGLLNSPSGELCGAWMQYNFDNPYTLEYILLWNFQPNLARGLKDFYIDYSTNGGSSWTRLTGPGLYGSWQIAVGQSPTELPSAINTGSLSNVNAILLSIPQQDYEAGFSGNWHGYQGEDALSLYGLSEVRFLVPGTMVISETDCSTALDEDYPAQTDSYDIYLTSAPTGNVTIDLDYDTTEMTLSPDPVELTPGDYSATVTVTVVSDDEQEGVNHTAVINHIVTSADPAFTFARPVGVTIRDKRFCGETGTVYLDLDLSGPQGVRDCYVNLYDFALLAEAWLDCTDPANVDCN